jgi:16S rRNA (uracil1498-N3)-methyltransferase
MARLFVARSCTAGDSLSLSEADSHYLREVLRLQNGEVFTAVLPGGDEAQVRVTGLRPQVAGRVEEISPALPGPPVRLVLYAALTKHKSWDYLVQKTTEIGVAEIRPLVTAHSVVQPRPDREAQQVQRWNRIAEAAGRQCEAPWAPQVHPPQELPAALDHWQGSGVPGVLFALAARHEAGANLRTVLRPYREAEALALFIGPEGGFSPEEVVQAQAAGLHLAGLGSRILRAETAAVVAAALCIHEFTPSPEGRGDEPHV